MIDTIWALIQAPFIQFLIVVFLAAIALIIRVEK